MVTPDYPQGAFLRKDLLGDSYEETQFKSAFVGFYWAVTTSTTTGYGDIYATSVMGRCVAIVCMFMGVLMLTLPVTVLSANFNEEYEQLKIVEAGLPLSEDEAENEHRHFQTEMPPSAAQSETLAQRDAKMDKMASDAAIIDEAELYIRRLELMYVELGDVIKNLKTMKESK
jgi:hypothetical protein